MYSLGDIKALHLEMTEKCQAGCPFCPRHMDDGSLNPKLINAELSFLDCVQFFPKAFIKQLDRMYMCGNYGDPIIAKDTLEVFEHFRYSNTKMSLDMHTNGGARDKDWWKDLAYVLHNERSGVIFSIDGLQDTNHIYRKHVNWNRVMDSAESFIQAGGNATWSFLVFRHNEHQVDEARRMSEKMGFKKFVAKKSSRFANQRAKHVIDLLPPLNPEYQNSSVNQLSKIVETYGSVEEFYNKTEIDCAVLREKSIYISARGLVFPCCWIGGIYEDKMEEVIKIYKNFEKVSLYKHSIEEIFNTNTFQDVEKTWKCSSISEGKLRICSKACSKENNFFKAQFE